MKKISFVVVLMSLLVVLAGCQMPFPSEETESGEETLVQPTAVSDPDATPLPDGSGSTDPNAGGGAPNMPPPTDERTAEPVEATVEPTDEPTEATVEPTQTAVSPTATPVPPTETPIPPTETAVPPTIAPTPTEPHRTHTVAPGENLYRISLQYGLAWPDVAAANGITNPDNIYAGQTLIIPMN